MNRIPEILKRMSPKLEWGKSIWMGVSIESEEYQYRLEHLKHTGAQVKFLSLEPLLGPLPDLNLDGIDWVIVGGESGPHARQIKQEWVIDIQKQCIATGTPFFFKQWGGVNKKKTGRLLKGKIWSQMPSIDIKPLSLQPA